MHATTDGTRELRGATVRRRCMVGLRARAHAFALARMLPFRKRVIPPNAAATPAAEPRDRSQRRKGRSTTAVRGGLGALLAFAALNAFGGGWYGLAGAKGVPTAWLRGTPFRDYFIPSLILVVGVGGSLLLAAVAVFGRWRQDRRLALAAALILFGWLAVEVAMIGYVSWMQPATAVGAALILGLALRLTPGRRILPPRGDGA